MNITLKDAVGALRAMVQSAEKSIDKAARADTRLAAEVHLQAADRALDEAHRFHRFLKDNIEVGGLWSVVRWRPILNGYERWSARMETAEDNVSALWQRLK